MASGVGQSKVRSFSGVCRVASSGDIVIVTGCSSGPQGVCFKSHGPPEMGPRAASFFATQRSPLSMEVVDYLISIKADMEPAVGRGLEG